MSEVDNVWNDKRVQEFGRKARREEHTASETRRRPWHVIKKVPKIRCGVEDYITNQWRILVITTVSIQVTYNSENFVFGGRSHFSVVKKDRAQ
jgi:hypothetical protein